jgi:UDP-glucose 4-epimerase
VSKLAAEQYCMVANRVFGVETVALRYFNVFGEFQDPGSGYAAVIPKFIRIMLEGERPTIFGDGETSRDFTHVENVVEANLAAAAAPAAAGRVMNVAIGSSHTLNELVRTLGALLDWELEPDHAPPRAGDVRESLADISLARELIGYEPSVEFEDGLERTIAWIVEQQRVAHEARSL